MLVANTGRDIVFSVASSGQGDPWIWGPTTGQLWRTTGDIADHWGSMIGIVDASSQRAVAARPGAWNDPDVLEIGNTVNWAEIGLAAGNASVRDLWQLLDSGPTPDAYTATVPSHGTVLLRIVGQEPPAPTGTAFLSDLVWTHAANGYGPAERDRSNGERGATDGKPLKVNGTTYAKGIGVHAGSILRVHLGGQCTTFSAKLGVDDEVGDRGSVSFEVWSGADRLYQSGLVTGAAPTLAISVDVSGREDLRLVVDPGFDDHDYDHADWADAQLTCN